jgi:hypothetical protein
MLVLCEAGQYDSRDACQQAVMEAVGTSAATQGGSGGTGTPGDGTEDRADQGPAGQGAAPGGTGAVDASEPTPSESESPEATPTVPATAFVLVLSAVFLAGLVGRRAR